MSVHLAKDLKDKHHVRSLPIHKDDEVRIKRGRGDLKDIRELQEQSGKGADSLPQEVVHSRGENPEGKAQWPDCTNSHQHFELRAHQHQNDRVP